MKKKNFLKKDSRFGVQKKKDSRIGVQPIF